METSRANVLIHRSDGQTFAMDDKPIGLLELKGVDAPAMEVFTEKNAVGDGDTVTGSRVAARDITIRAKSRGGIKNAICAPGRWCFLIRNSPTTWISATTV